MKWSWRIGRIASIDVFVHATFLILLAWVAIAHYTERQSIADALSGLLFIVALFAIVVLHELGHALAARRYGIQTRDITLLPIGGVARLERMPSEPSQELVVALAGPAVNVALAAFFFLLLSILGGTMTMDELAVVGGPFLAKMTAVNVLLAAFNMLPAFPMDGGRVLRALLAMRLDYVRATQVAATIGQLMALVFGFAGLFGNPFLVFIALFVWVGATAESSYAMMQSALAGIPVSRAMITDYRTLAPSDPLAEAVNHVVAGFQQDFPVVDDGHVVGVLTRDKLFDALAKEGQQSNVGEVMERSFETANPLEMLESIVPRLQACRCHSIPVVRDNQLVGIMTMDNLGEFVMIQSALREAKA